MVVESLVSPSSLRVLVACECSGRVKMAFRKRGFDAWSCDLKASEIPDDLFHIQGDVRDVLKEHWDLLIGHPPCTYLSYVGTRHWNKPGRAELREEAMKFFMTLVNAPVEHIAIENPLGYAIRAYKTYDQIIQPYYFGKQYNERYLKRTCLWLKDLPKLYYQPWDDCFGKKQALDYPEPMGYLKTTGKPIHWTEMKHGGETRSRSWQGISDAMAKQWGDYLLGLEKGESEIPSYPIAKMG